MKKKSGNNLRSGASIF